MARMNPTDLLAEDAPDTLERIELQIARQTRLLEEIRELLAAQAQRTASMRSADRAERLQA
jgi:uncharacterized coiled-coil protein SlyX